MSIAQGIRWFVIVTILMGTMFIWGMNYANRDRAYLHEQPVRDITDMVAEIDDPSQYVSFKSVPKAPDALKAARISMERALFGGPRQSSLPHMQPLSADQFSKAYATEAVFEEYYLGLFESRRVTVDELSGTFDALKGYTWKSLLLRQNAGTSRGLFIFHQGHDGSPFAFPIANTILASLLERGYDILVFCMPGIGWNRIENVAIKTWDGWGYLAGRHENKHALFTMIDTGDGHFIRYFVEPVVASLDRVLANHRYERVIMGGHSGGGWTTTMVAALDDRISHSISYAGTLPYFAKHSHRDLGDPEQYDSAFYRRFPYPTLYELATWRARGGRIHYQLYSDEDDCCFNRNSTKTLLRYLRDRPSSPSRDLRVKIFRNKSHDMIPEAFLGVVDELQPVEFLSGKK